MLTYLKVKNFAIIDELEIDFHKGLNVLSGETGAGKSILLKSLQLILGGKTNPDTIRDKDKDVEIQSIFNFDKESLSLKKLQELEFIEFGQNELIIRRVFNSQGSGKIFINGNAVTQSQLRKMSVYLVDICGQHENQSLTESSNQKENLDSYAGSEKILKEVLEKFHSIKAIEKSIDKLTIDENAKQMRLNYLKFQLKELNEVDISPEEESDLMKQSLKFEGLKDISDLCQKCEQVFYGEESSVIFPLEELRNQIKKNLKYDPSFEKQADKLNKIIEDLEESGQYFVTYAKKLNVDDEDIEMVHSKIETIKKLKKKYSVNNLTELFEKKKGLSLEYTELNNQEKALKKLNEELVSAKNNYFEVSEKLTKLRQKAALEMSKKVTEELQDLKMNGAKFSIEVENSKIISASGADTIIFKISPNKGEGLKPIDKIASGGELSRMLLAVNRVLTENSLINSYIYDEIDAGIGGETGLIVGKKLREIAARHQVICITHLPQVAVFADSHLVISKTENKNRVLSEVNELKTDGERISELARMLGGNLVKNESLEHAKAMLIEARKITKK